jgi:histidine triad (HIT) family protein
MEECIFCKIARKEIRSNVVYEDENFIAFRDINPQAPIHVLLIPKMHINSLNDIDAENVDVLSKICLIIKNIALSEKITEDGYRVVVNTGSNAGQAVKHLHFHILGGRKFSWPPG